MEHHILRTGFTTMMAHTFFYSPYFIFIKCAGLYSDQEIFALLQIPFGKYLGTISHQSNEFWRKYVYITEDHNWIHIMDNWIYNLWNMKNIRENIEKIACVHDVYSCSVGDSDLSYDLAYYQKGIKLREIVVSNNLPEKIKVELDFGIPFAKEAEITTRKSPKNSFWEKMRKPKIKYVDEMEFVLSIAQDIGININHRDMMIRAYELNLK